MDIIKELEKIRDEKCSWGEIQIIDKAIEMIKNYLNETISKTEDE